MDATTWGRTFEAIHGLKRHEYRFQWKQLVEVYLTPEES